MNKFYFNIIITKYKYYLFYNKNYFVKNFVIISDNLINKNNLLKSNLNNLVLSYIKNKLFYFIKKIKKINIKKDYIANNKFLICFINF